MSMWSIGSPLGEPDVHVLRDLSTGESVRMSTADAQLVARMMRDEFGPCPDCEEPGCLRCRCCLDSRCMCGCPTEPTGQHEEHEEQENNL